MQRIQIHNRLKTLSVTSLSIIRIMLLLGLSSRTTNVFLVVVDALSVTKPVDIFHVSNFVAMRRYYHSTTTIPNNFGFIPPTSSYSRIQILKEQSFCTRNSGTSTVIRRTSNFPMIQYESESKSMTGIDTSRNRNRIQKLNKFFDKFPLTQMGNLNFLDMSRRCNKAASTTTTIISSSPESSTALQLLDAKSNELEGRQQDSERSRTTSSSASIRRLLLLVLVGSLGYSTVASRVANAAVLSSVAVAAATGSSASTSGIVPSINNNQLTIVAAMIVLNAIGNMSFSVVVSAIRSFATWYMMNLNTFPLLTKAVTAGVIGIAGDYMAQWLEYLLLQRKREKTNNLPETSQHKWSTRQTTAPSNTVDMASIRHTILHTLSINGNYHLRRGLSILVDGMLISGPLMHIGYDYFEKIVPVSGVGGVTFFGMSSATIAALSHVFADSIVLDSIFIASTFIMTGLFEGYSPKQLIPQFKMDYIPSLKASWLTSLALLPIEFVCFRFLPLSFRVLAVNFIDVVWDAVISFMAHRNRDLQHQSTTVPTERIIDNNISDMIISDSCCVGNNNNNNDVIVLSRQCYSNYQNSNENRSAIMQ